MVLVKPSPINMESMADEEDHDVVGANDQDQKNKSRNHHPLCTKDGERNILTLPDTFRINKKEQTGGASCGDSHPWSQTSSQPILKHRFRHQLMKKP